MARLRYVDLSGTIGSSGLTNSATSHTFTAPLTYANGTTVPTLTGSDDFVLTILNTAGTAVSEVIRVIAYNSGTGAATIVRAQEGTTAASHTSGDKVTQSVYPSEIVTPDTPPASANAKDDEFDGTSSVTWSATPTAPNAIDVNTTIPGALYIKSSGANAYVGRVQAVPGAYPFTITTRLLAATARRDFQRGGGIVLGPASPTGSSALVYAGLVHNSGLIVQRILGTFGGSFTSNASVNTNVGLQSIYIRMIVTSATSVACYVSLDGKLWLTIETGFNPGFTPGVMGLATNEEAAGGGVESSFAFFRVT